MSSTSAFLHRLSQQLIQVSKLQHRQVPLVAIRTEDQRNCDNYKRVSTGLTSIVKVEVEDPNENCGFTNNAGNNEGNLIQQSWLVFDCTSINIPQFEVCNLCSQSTLTGYRLNASICEKEKLLEDIFEGSFNDNLELPQQWIFCELCFHIVEHMRVCYLKFKEAKREYHETLLRIRCFKKCAQNIALSDSLPNHDAFENSNGYSDDESIGQSLDFNVTNELPEQNPPVPIIIRLSKKKLRTGSRKMKRKNTFKGKVTRRRGGITEEEYQERRRRQMAGYYQNRKKRRMGMVENEEKPLGTALKDETLKTEYEHDDSLESGPISPISNQAIDNMSIRNDYEEHLRGKEEQLAVATGKEEKLISTSKDSFKSKPRKRRPDKKEIGLKNKKKKKDDRTGKTIRRHGGVSEEEYQANRRAQSRKYYIERRLRLGKMTYGPKPLTLVEKKRLEKAEKLRLDSNNLPARSSCGVALPVIQLETGKRFSYRNVEITVDDDCTLHCGNCDHTSKTLNVTKKHIAKNHFDKEHGFKCSYCDRTFYYRYQLNYHENRHTEKGAGVQCEECGQSFKHPTTFFAHRRIVHLQIKPHECQLCQKKFGTRKDLRKHTESKSHLAMLASCNSTEVGVGTKMPQTTDFNPQFR